MAFMGYETPVEMPSMGIYNTDLMKMYIAGVKDQYEKGQEEMKDFMKLYGDFYSPIAGDTLTYNDMTIGGARDMINQMLANGIDPYKSPEARAAISRYIASVPTGTLNAMKQNAENRKAYDQAVAQARLSGKYDPEYEAWALKQAGLDNFSTIGPNGEIRTWDRLAPDPKQDWETFTTPYFKNFKAQEYLGPSRPGYMLRGTKPEKILNATNASYSDLLNSPWGRYQIDQARRQVENMANPDGSPLTLEQKLQAVEQILRGHIQDAATHYFQPKEEEDSWYLKMYEIANNNHQKALDRALDAYQFRVRYGDGSDDSSGNGGKSNDVYSTPLSIQYTTESDSRVNEALGEFRNARLQRFVEKAADYRAKHPTGNIKTKEQAVAWWNKALADPEKYGLVDSKGKETKLLRDWYARTGMIVGITTKDGKVVRGEKDAQHFDAQDNLSAVFKGKTVGARQLSNAADKMYKKYMTEPASNEERKVLNNQLTGTDKKQTVIGESGQYRIFQGDKTIQFTPYRRASLFNGGRLISKAVRDFNTWLQSGSAQIVQRNTNSKVAMLPRGSNSYSYELSRLDLEYDKLKHGTSATAKNAVNREMLSLGNNKSMDIVGYGDITMSDFKRFIAYTMNKETSDVSTDDEKYYLSALGLSAYNTYGSRSDVSDDKKFVAGNIKYVRIPITKPINQ